MSYDSSVKLVGACRDDSRIFRISAKPGVAEMRRGLARIDTILIESLILAQDERWRRA